ncbi:MAG: double-strand break repair helicase AddA [Alphaproteobacteria bacterium]|nr:double-strand break repair helicase AddA [Alphaproteobacteria bacterium]
MNTPPSSSNTVQKHVSNGSSEPQTIRNDESRPLDPNVLQGRAANPEKSVWVSASAGTGKTKVLTDRVLRLLLPRASGEPGCKAHKILCLTFTKAGAGEMALRISKTLAEWAVMEDASLSETLQKLLDREIKTDDMRAARKLFADVVDVPGGLKIMTIHSFCQSVLGRFPLEAGISPNFTVLEDMQAQTLLTRAIQSGLQTSDVPTSSTQKALDHVAATINEEQFTSIIKDIIRERGQFEKVLKRHFGVEGIYTAICAMLNIQPDQSTTEYLAGQCDEPAFDKDGLLSAARALIDIGSAKTDAPNGELIASWLSVPTEERIKTFHAYKGAFLTQKNEKRAKLATKAVTEAAPDALDVLDREAERVLQILDTLNAIENAALTRDVLTLGQNILSRYEELKAAQNALDFDDLILRTLALLKGETMEINIEQASSWVHYKLDQGLDHILIDEAQDTNPEQWQIVEALCTEFYENSANNDTNRSVFTVGDKKQSIYSFQRASPDEFDRMMKSFEAKTLQADMQWDDVPMDISFRSVRSILECVNAVFESDEARDGLEDKPLKHSAFRRGQAGHVELWPLFESDEKDELPLWSVINDAQESLSAQTKLAQHIAAQAKQWINAEKLESHDRTIKAGDIMILVRTRSALVHHIARALKDNGIPVSGLDRMVLNTELVIEDLIAIAQMAIQPHDDLTLATVLKSPFIGMNEDALFTLCNGRGEISVWSALHKSTHETIKDYLSSLVHLAGSMTPFEFIMHLLHTPCPAHEASGLQALKARLGNDVIDPINEFLTQSQNYERIETPSLLKFLHALRNQTTEIKRDHEEEGDVVRIMTVHGSKGLQAPIVILPDTTGGVASAPSRAEKRLLWPDQSGLGLPLWSPRKDMDCTTYRDGMAHLDHRLEQEYRRLLYVAMTRAEDRLYVGGALSGRSKDGTAPDNCWYSLIQNGITRHEGHEETEDGRLILAHPQTNNPDKTAKKSEKENPETTSLPVWAHQRIKDEAQTHSILRPSHIDDSALSPLESSDNHRFLRGNLTHKLLQILPDIEDSQREQAAKTFLQRFGTALSDDIHADITKETLDILRNPEFSALFGPDSQAEVPITGLIENQNGQKQQVSGQIDRLLIKNDKILIVDYKTNRPPPQDEADIPAIYTQQMHTYAAVLKQIYPAKPVRAYLLWTDGPRLMQVDTS